MTLSGKYRMAGDDVTFELDGEGEAGGKIQGNTFVDNEGKVWQKEGTSEPPKWTWGSRRSHAYSGEERGFTADSRSSQMMGPKKAA